VRTERLCAISNEDFLPPRHQDTKERQKSPKELTEGNEGNKEKMPFKIFVAFVAFC
jgi:hypothetical protein